MKKVLKGIIPLFTIAFLWAGSVSAVTPVKIGGYIFPPFVEKASDGKFSGITIDMIKALNHIQSEYDFQFVFTSPRRRYQGFETKSYDMLFFESIHWGWQKQPIKPTKVFLKGGEVFIALKKIAKNQTYFKSLKDKSKVGMLGYHYSFAQFNADPNFLKKNHKMYLTNDSDTNIKLVLNGRRDIAIVTKSYLDKYLKSDSSAKSKLLVSAKLDQEYNHTILVRKGSTPDVAKMNALLDQLSQTGELKKVFKKYGITQ